LLRSAGGAERTMRSFALVHRAVGRLSRIVALAGIAMLAGAMAITMADILLRRLFAFAMIGTVDMVQLCIMSTAFLSIPYAFIRGSHVGIEAATDLLPKRALALVKAMAALAGFGFMAAIGWFGLEQAELQYGYGDVSQTIAIPMLYYWLPLLAGAALSVLATTVLAVRFLIQAATGCDPLEPEVRS
jgi:TRAP-type C4-dicarboxylate transport system permease small subunit